MGTFASNVRDGDVERFDPSLEEKGGWILGEAPKHNMEMTNAVICVLMEANQHAIKVPSTLLGHKLMRSFLVM